MLTQAEIENNKNTIISLVNDLNRTFDKQAFLNMLLASDFFVAPATTQYYGSYEGGLVEHLLKVYKTMSELVSLYKLNISADSIILVSLFHDLYKMNFYESYIQNKKIYSESGSKYDNAGKYDWYSVAAYKVKDSKERFIFGTNQETSEYILSQYVPLLLEESRAILSYKGSDTPFIPEVLSKSNLATLLYASKILSCYLKEDM